MKCRECPFFKADQPTEAKYSGDGTCLLDTTKTNSNNKCDGRYYDAMTKKLMIRLKL